MTAEIDMAVLGEIELRVDGERRSLPGRRQRAVLAHLALQRRRPVPPDVLIDALWDDAPPRTARNSLQRFVADIRRALEPHAARMRTTPAGYCLWIADDECDIGRAQSAIAAAERAAAAGVASAARRHHATAASMWRGPSLRGAGESLRTAAEADRLDRLGVETREAAAELAIDGGDAAEVIDGLRALTAGAPTRESASLLLARALHVTGRSVDALDELARLRRRSREDLGLDPSARVGELEHRIIVQDPGLQPEPAVRSLPAQLRRALERPMVGRREQIDAARTALRAAVHGEPAMLLISGEPGIGKTRLLAELAVHASDAGAVVRYGRGEPEVRAGFEPWAEALSGELDESDWASGMSQIELFRRVLQTLERSASVAPHVLILDDLHWADRSTVDLLVHVLRRLPGGVLVVGAYRDTEPDVDHLDAIEAVAVEEHRSVPLRLTGLADGEVAELVATLDGGAHGPEDAALVDVVRRETAGNPFFATEIARHARELRCAGDGRAGAPGLPQTVRTVVGHRVARLERDVARTLVTASGFGREFELRVLARVLDQTERAVLDSLERAEAAALVADAPDDARRMTFTHDLIHHVLLDDLGRARRAGLHHRIADAMEAESAADGRDRTVDIAHHLIAAADPRLADRTCQAARRAGALAASRHAPAEAAQLLQTAIDQLELLPMPDEARRAELLVELGVQQRRLGDPEHRHSLREAGRLAQRVGAHHTLVSAAVANTGDVHSHVFEIDHDEIAFIEDALAVVGEEPSSERASLLAALANQRWSPEDRELSRRLRDESIRMARDVGDPATLVDVLIRATRSRRDPPSIEEVAALNDEARTVSRRHDVTDPLLELNRLRSEQQLAIQTADAVRHAIVVGEIQRHAARYPLPACTQSSLLAEATMAGFAGDPDRYEALAEQALHIGVASGDPEAWLIYEAQLFYARMVQGRTAELVDDLVRIADERPQTTIYRAVLSWVLCEQGRTADAAALIDAQLARGFDYHPNLIDVQELMLWAEGAAGSSRRDAAAVLASLLARHSGGLGGHLNQVTQPLDLTIGRLRHVLGDIDGAHRHLDLAAEIADRFDAPWMRARTNLSRAQVLRSVGDTAWVDAARRARQLADEHDYRGLRTQADQLSAD